MSDEYAEDWKEIVRLSNLDDHSALTKLTRYVMEGCRIVSSAAGVSRFCAKDIVIPDVDGDVHCSVGDQIFIDLVPTTTRLLVKL